jgi:hypothetical protein
LSSAPNHRLACALALGAAALSSNAYAPYHDMFLIEAQLLALLAVQAATEPRVVSGSDLLGVVQGFAAVVCVGEAVEAACRLAFPRSLAYLWWPAWWGRVTRHRRALLREETEAVWKAVMVCGTFFAAAAAVWATGTHLRGEPLRLQVLGLVDLAKDGAVDSAAERRVLEVASPHQVPLMGVVMDAWAHRCVVDRRVTVSMEVRDEATGVRQDLLDVSTTVEPDPLDASSSVYTVCVSSRWQTWIGGDAGIAGVAGIAGIAAHSDVNATTIPFNWPLRVAETPDTRNSSSTSPWVHHGFPRPAWLGFVTSSIQALPMVLMFLSCLFGPFILLFFLCNHSFYAFRNFRAIRAWAPPAVLAVTAGVWTLGTYISLFTNYGMWALHWAALCAHLAAVPSSSTLVWLLRVVPILAHLAAQIHA